MEKIARLRMKQKSKGATVCMHYQSQERVTENILHLEYDAVYAE